MMRSSLFCLLCVVVICYAVDASRPVDVIEHVIIFMQENRPFDHYFGKLKGVRGFNDRTTVPLRSGLNAFYQPIDQNNLNEYMLPFRADSNKTNAMCMPAPEMYYPTDIAMWNSGRMDSWNTARYAGMGMSYFTRDDLPYYYVLYDNFVCGDQYYQSTFTSTTPNRMMLFSGSNGLSVGEDAILDNTEPRPGYNWTTMGEILEASNISWRVYQQLDNFDDNGFAWFSNFQKSRPGDVLFDKGMSRQRNAIEAFQNDLINNTLPQVSWIIAPTRKSEHATNHPSAGEDYTARILNTLSSFPEIYKKSVFILNYDEGGQFFDHAWTPTPPLSSTEGLSTVTVDGEINTAVMTEVPAPIGMGYRVPLLIVSPWTRGEVVLSEVLDHTSVIQFLELRFNVSCPNISPWRRAMTGNLLSAFDFDHPQYDWPQGLPDTSGYVEEGDVECHTLPPPVVPEVQSMPQQEPGTRISRALPYEFLVADSLTVGSTTNDVTIAVTVDNTGAAGAPLVLYDVLNLASTNPRQYAVEAGKAVTDTVTIPATTDVTATAAVPYHYALMGPNGFVRIFQGSAPLTVGDLCSSVSASLHYDIPSSAVVVRFTNTLQDGGEEATFELVDNAYNQLAGEVRTVVVTAGASVDLPIPTAASGNWYDLTVTLQLPAGSTEQCYLRRFMGRMETGVDGPSDPAMGAALPGLWGTHSEDAHPRLPARLRDIARVQGKHAEVNKDALFYTIITPTGTV